MSLSAEGICKRYGALEVLADVSLQVRQGTVTGLIGPNGAGKTTLVNALTGYTRPEAGGVSFDGQSIDRLSPVERARLGIARTFQTPRLLEDLTVEENIRLGGQLRSSAVAGVRADEHMALGSVDAAADLLGFDASIRRAPARLLSAGERRLVECARSLVGRPTTLLLDEPFAGLTTPEIRRVAEVVRVLAEDVGLAVLLIEHNLSEVFALCDDVFVLDRGSIVASGPTKDVQASTTVKEIFFGGRDDQKHPSGLRLATDADVALTARDLHAGYGRLEIVKGVDLTARAGEAVGLVGVNGAGKTTLLHSLMGTARILSGSLTLRGSSIEGLSTRQRVRSGLALVPEGRRLFLSLSVADNLRVAAEGAGLTRRQAKNRIYELCELFPTLLQFEHRAAGELSGGQQQLVAIARALMSEPSVLLLDEPSIGLSHPALDELAPVLRQLMDNTEVAIVLAEQNLHFAGQLCNHIALIDRGAITGTGGPELLDTAWDLATTRPDEVESEAATREEPARTTRIAN